MATVAPASQGSVPTKTSAVTVSEVKIPKDGPPAPAGYKLVKIKKPDGTIVTVKRPIEHGVNAVPEGFKLVKVKKPDGTIVTVKRPIANGSGPAATNEKPAAAIPASTAESTAAVPKPATKPVVVAPVPAPEPSARSIAPTAPAPAPTAAKPAPKAAVATDPGQTRKLPISSAKSVSPSAAPAATQTATRGLSAENVSKAAHAVSVDNVNQILSVTSHLFNVGQAVAAGDLDKFGKLAAAGVPKAGAPAAAPAATAATKSTALASKAAAAAPAAEVPASSTRAPVLVDESVEIYEWNELVDGELVEEHIVEEAGDVYEWDEYQNGDVVEEHFVERDVYIDGAGHAEQVYEELEVYNAGEDVLADEEVGEGVVVGEWNPEHDVEADSAEQLGGEKIGEDDEGADVEGGGAANDEENDERQEDEDGEDGDQDEDEDEDEDEDGDDKDDDDDE